MELAGGGTLESTSLFVFLLYLKDIIKEIRNNKQSFFDINSAFQKVKICNNYYLFYFKLFKTNNIQSVII